jgi:hypothetical protein
MHTQIALCSFAISSYEGFASFLVTHDRLEVCLFAQRGDVAASIRFVTKRRSLFPASSARHPRSAPCDDTCLNEAG